MTDWMQVESWLKQVDPRQVEANKILAPLTSYTIGGPARLFVAPVSEENVDKVLETLTLLEIEPFVLGGGSNVLISDTGWDGVVLHIGQNLSGWEFEGNTATVFAGTSLLPFIRAAVNRGLGGMELMAGIPGSVGGALRMNAGAFGQEIEASVVKVRGFFPDGAKVALGRAAIEFGYRSAPELQRVIITSAQFEFSKEDTNVLTERMDDVLRMRKTKQPLEFPSCGSVFKRPPGYYAGALIEEVGMKGKVHGRAQVSTKHAGFIVNLGGATAKQVRELMELVAAKVKKRFGVELEREVKLIGFDDVRE
ncbi:UDP-N-acetylmuramate dehydrogenase [bacterium]|nr:UDP-N-acetylmuramate dehydrogenase [bacterium]